MTASTRPGRLQHGIPAPVGGSKADFPADHHSLHDEGHYVSQHLRATLQTNHGPIVINLFPDHAPKTVANFVELSDGTREWTNPTTGAKSHERFYDGLTFHRVIGGFMIQGGCPLGNGMGGPGYEFDDEPHPELVFDKPYLLAMANAGKRFGKGTNGSQFFITVGRTPHLNFKHTIFGEVADQASRDVVDAIAGVPTGGQDRPLEPVVIESVSIDRGDAAG